MALGMGTFSEPDTEGQLLLPTALPVLESEEDSPPIFEEVLDEHASGDEQTEQ